MYERKRESKTDDFRCADESPRALRRELKSDGRLKLCELDPRRVQCELLLDDSQHVMEHASPYESQCSNRSLHGFLHRAEANPDSSRNDSQVENPRQPEGMHTKVETGNE